MWTIKITKCTSHNDLHGSPLKELPNPDKNNPGFGGFFALRGKIEGSFQSFHLVMTKNIGRITMGKMISVYHRNKKIIQSFSGNCTLFQPHKNPLIQRKTKQTKREENNPWQVCSMIFSHWRLNHLSLRKCSFPQWLHVSSPAYLDRERRELCADCANSYWKNGTVKMFCNLHASMDSKLVQ